MLYQLDRDENGINEIGFKLGTLTAHIRSKTSISIALCQPLGPKGCPR
jgi:hypothetical protein